MGFAADAVAAGYTGYQGWGDAEAQADYNATGGAGKIGGGGGGSGPGSIPAFNFDYAAEAEKAYGELGTYYAKLLDQSEGDLNLALSRLVEDYDRGVRVKKEDTTSQKATIDAQQAEADRRQGLAVKNTENTILRRGIGQTSNYTADQNKGDLANNLLINTNAPYTYNTGIRERNKQTLTTNLNRYTDLYDPVTGVYTKRKQVDTATNISRKKDQLEQARRTEAANISNQRGSQAYNNYLANPSLV